VAVCRDTDCTLTDAPARSMSDSLREQPLELPAPACRAPVTSEIWKMECDLDDVSLADVLPVVRARVPLSMAVSTSLVSFTRCSTIPVVYQPRAF